MNPVVRAIFRRDMRRYFGSVLGYVFILCFVLVAAFFLFVSEGTFFNTNLANLDALNSVFMVLIAFFAPLVTMSLWAGERSQGTDELILTLPATDSQIVVGKFLAATGIYTVSLLFCLPLLGVIEVLGNPDWGLLLANMVGYWLVGTTMLAAGMIGSQLSSNTTVAFVLGLLFTLGAVLADSLLKFAGWSEIGPMAQFEPMTRGAIPYSAIIYFLGFTVAFLYFCRLLLSRRHWVGAEGLHFTVRFGCLVLVAIAAGSVTANVGGRVDTTTERIHSLSEESRELVASIEPERPVYVQAYLTPAGDVPREYAGTHRTLVNLLDEFDAIGGDRIQVSIVETERFSEEARDAEERFDIGYRTVADEKLGRITPMELYMGIAFNCGLEEVVMPFVDKGLPIEYELTRSIRVVSAAKRKRIGVLDTDVDVFGGFDFQTMNQSPQWEIVRELKLQYDVEQVTPESLADYLGTETSEDGTDAAAPEPLDALIAVMASTLTQPQLDNVRDYVMAGNPTLIIDDPWPLSAPGNSPSDEKGGPRNPFQQNQPPPEPKGDIRGMLEEMGIRWPTRDIVWDGYNPHPQLAVEPELVFVGDGSDSSEAFNSTQAISSGLQEVVTIFGGHCRDAAIDGLRFIPLLRSSPLSGTLSYDTVLRRDPFFGRTSLNPMRIHRDDSEEYTLAARVQGQPRSSGADGTGRDIDVIFLADADMIGNQFFGIRSQGIENLNFDNVTFLLNCVDSLAGDESFIDLRKRRPEHRTLTMVENITQEFMDELLKTKQEAEESSNRKLDEAQARLDAKVAEIEQRTDLDENSKAIQKETVRSVEQRRLDIAKVKIEEEKARAIDAAEGQRQALEAGIRSVVMAAGVFAPVPFVLLVALFVFLRRRSRERATLQSATTGGV